MGLCWHDGLSEFGRYICDGILALMDCPNGEDEIGVCDGNSKLMECQNLMGMKCHHIISCCEAVLAQYCYTSLKCLGTGRYLWQGGGSGSNDFLRENFSRPTHLAVESFRSPLDIT